MKRMMVIMLTIMMLSSCYYADQVFGDIRNENFNSLGRKKMGVGRIKMINTRQEYTKL